jgi:hypothetical protein
MYYLSQFSKEGILQDIVDYLIQEKIKKYNSDFKKIYLLKNQIIKIIEDEIKKTIPEKHLQIFKKYGFYNNKIDKSIIWFCIDVLNSNVIVNSVGYYNKNSNKNSTLKKLLKQNITEIPTKIVLPIIIDNKNKIEPEYLFKQIVIKILNDNSSLYNKILEIINIEKEFYIDIKNIRDEYKKRLKSKRTLETLFRSYPKIKDMLNEKTIDFIKKFQNTTISKEKYENSKLYIESEKNLELYEKEILSDN